MLDSPVVTAIAQKHNKSTAQVLLRHLAEEGVIVLAKSVNPARVKANYQVPYLQHNRNQYSSKLQNFLWLPYGIRIYMHDSNFTRAF